jgi:Protein of unknown function (DUF1360)
VTGSTFLGLVVIALGVWRIWRLISTDTILDKPRDWLLGTSQPIPGGPTHYARPGLAEFIGCPYCFGFWLSVGAFASWHWWDEWNTVLIAVPLALSAAVGVMTKLDE